MFCEGCVPITVIDEEEYREINIVGDLDLALIADAKTVFQQVVESAVKDIRVNLTDSEFLDSAGIGALVMLNKRITSKGYKLTLTGLREQPFGLVSLLRLDRIIQIEKL